MKRKSIMALATGTAVAAALTFAGVAPANAISRASCGTTYLQIHSPSTTCWANAGTASVVLYSTQSLSAGNNAGYVKDGDWKVSFAKGSLHSWATRTITTVHID
jgi:hypothetical protein